MSRNTSTNSHRPRARRAGALCALAAGTALLLGCGGPTLGPWHTVVLTEDYRASRADEIRTFEDYLKLEDRLFRQLESTVYVGDDAGPDAALLRYRKGSPSDPQARDPNWNRSFELPAAAPVGGVLLLHGMSDSPYSLRALGEELNRRNYWVVGLRLPGHGTAPSGLLGVRWEDMAAAVGLAAGHLERRVGEQPLHIVGYSTGATLALDYTLKAIDGQAAPMPASLVLVSPAVGIHAAAAAAGWKRRAAALPGLGNLAWLNVEPEFDPYKYNSFTTNAGEQVHRLTRSVSRRVASLASARQAGALPPILVFKSTVDATVSTDAVVTQLLGRLDAGRHELVLFDINRYAAKTPLLIADSAPLTNRVMGDARLPFAVTLVTNENEESDAVVAVHQPPLSAGRSQPEPLHLSWPPGVISLSHVALPFPPDDPLYGQRPPDNREILFLGQMAIQGERDLLVLPADWLLRLRHNPFYSYLNDRALSWIDSAGGVARQAPAPSAEGADSAH